MEAVVVNITKKSKTKKQNNGWDISKPDIKSETLKINS